MRILGGLLIASLLACGQRDAPAEAPPPTPEPPVAAPEPAPEPEAPCIVGEWQANDFVSAIRREIRGDLRDARMTRASGTITIAIKPANAHGLGELVATADDLVHRVTVGGGAIRGSATHTMTGGSTMPWRMPAPDRLLILPPTEGELSARLNVSLRIGKKRHGRSNARTTPVNFAGLYVFDCNEERLAIRRVRMGNEFDEPVVLDRVTDSESEAPQE